MELISREAALAAISDDKGIQYPGWWYKDRIRTVPGAQRWIPFTLRQATDEEKAEHPHWDVILDCKLPDDYQRILVCINCKGHESVQLDEYYIDAEGSYLGSGYEIGTEAVAWMPLPAPFTEEVTT